MGSLFLVLLATFVIVIAARSIGPKLWKTPVTGEAAGCGATWFQPLELSSRVDSVTRRIH